MRIALHLRWIAVASLGVAGLCSVAMGATVAQTPPVMPMPPGVAEDLGELADQPAAHTGFTFDRSELQLARGVLESGGLDADRAAAALTGLSFDTYRYKEPALYTPETMAAIIEAYHRAGWKHMVNGNQTPANSAQPRTAITDLWLHFNGADIDHVTILVRAARDMSLIQVSGDLPGLEIECWAIRG